MTTPRDLLTVALDVAPDRQVEQGDLSLALAGAELIDLVGAHALTLEEEAIVPGAERALGDRLLDEAQSVLVRQAPYESVEDWLWRRGRGLAGVYVAALEADGEVAGRRRGWLPLRSGPTVRHDSPEHRRATERWTSGEPVLTVLGAAAGLGDEAAAEDLADIGEGAVATVLNAVHDAVAELGAVRQRKQIEEDAFDNIWRAP
ncbi:GPP34 family phosphoprotein [Streptomyces sp. NPDC086787]|uniref:GOLPH3/VPS74 family protein n=1 Tax=Streptomyces sp. NPDC086787 TaxID=3365759 RepID=UPI0037FBEF63